MKRTPKKSLESQVWREFDRIACEKHGGQFFLVGYATGVVAGFGGPAKGKLLNLPRYPSAVAALKAATASEGEDAD
jgi:hypothetical protein